MSARNGVGMTSERTRLRMVEALRKEGFTDERALGAMAEIPRHLFIDEGIASRAYEDVALPIGHGQTISSPSIVAMMTGLLLEKRPMGRVLEVGTGCGYQTAVLARLAKEVYTLERVAPLMDKARRHLRDLRFYNIRYKHADGHGGYPEGAIRNGRGTTSCSSVSRSRVRVSPMVSRWTPPRLESASTCPIRAAFRS